MTYSTSEPTTNGFYMTASGIWCLVDGTWYEEDSDETISSLKAAWYLGPIPTYGEHALELAIKIAFAEMHETYHALSVSGKFEAKDDYITALFAFECGERSPELLAEMKRVTIALKGNA